MDMMFCIQAHMLKRWHVMLWDNAYNFHICTNLPVAKEVNYIFSNLVVYSYQMCLVLVSSDYNVLCDIFDL